MKFNVHPTGEAIQLSRNGFLVFGLMMLLIYTIIDYLNLPYREMIRAYSLGLVILNISLNSAMAILSAVLMQLSETAASQKGIKLHGGNLSFISVIFGVLTYGCTPCVIALFASIGINFSVMVLPLAGLPYKLVSLGLLLIGIFWMKHDLKKKQCAVSIN